MKIISHGNRGLTRKIWGCPILKYRSNRCHGICKAHNGIGECGRAAPQAIRGRTQRAIYLYNSKMLQEKAIRIKR